MNRTKHNPMDMLLAEHDNIQLLLQETLRWENSWETDPGGFEKKIKMAMLFFQQYADCFHHAKEEEVLFPSLAEHPDFRLQGMLEELTEHHVQFREYLQEMQELWNEKAYVGLFRVLVRYVRELLDHIAIENDELFVMAAHLFSENELEQMYFQFQDIDRELGKEEKTQWEEKLSQNLYK